MMSAREAAALLGGQATSAVSLVCPGPGHSPRDGSLSVRFDAAAQEGFIVCSHAGDDWQACRDHVRAALGLGLWQPKGGDRQLPRPSRPPSEASPDKRKLALRIWEESRCIHGTVAERYLASRGLEVDDRAEQSLRFHPACPFEGARLPCLVALFRDLGSGDRPVAIHRTALTPDGEKIGRKMLGPVAGAAVKLDPDENVELGLVVAEGVETALAARMLGYRPCWALGSAGAIGRVPVLGGIEALTIVGEADDSGTNEREAKACARRWLAAGAEVSILDPVGGGDANDVLLRSTTS